MSPLRKPEPELPKVRSRYAYTRQPESPLQTPYKPPRQTKQPVTTKSKKQSQQGSRGHRETPKRKLDSSTYKDASQVKPSRRKGKRTSDSVSLRFKVVAIIPWLVTLLLWIKMVQLMTPLTKPELIQPVQVEQVQPSPDLPETVDFPSRPMESDNNVDFYPYDDSSTGDPPSAE